MDSQTAATRSQAMEKKSAQVARGFLISGVYGCSPSIGNGEAQRLAETERVPCSGRLTSHGVGVDGVSGDLNNVGCVKLVTLSEATRNASSLTIRQEK